MVEGNGLENRRPARDREFESRPLRHLFETTCSENRRPARDREFVVHISATMKKVVIAGSAKLQDDMQKWVNYWNGISGHSVLDYPVPIPQENFERLYPDVYKNFFRNIASADVLFVANERKNGIEGYIGAETFAEMSFGLTQKLLNGKDIKLILAHMPTNKVACHDEIVLWEKLGWIDEILNR